MPDEAPEYDGRAVWISRANPDGYGLIKDYLKSINANIDHGKEPGKVEISQPRLS